MSRLRRVIEYKVVSVRVKAVETKGSANYKAKGFKRT